MSPLYLPAHALVEARQDAPRQARQVGEPFAQRRHVHAYHVEAVIEILAEPPGRYLLLQIAVGGGDQAGFDPDGGLVSEHH